ncbi:MFS transporter [Amycolatopsis sp. K13G38]|uniref:MFS transporter n=1 Tax=Amycolatopsis acididurans TaxID=2724524 RepID=A0ABX1JC18_9PSEU|nr:MFS transporter [Amycolatopsis acididurans]NKQ57218.1 MFS transporter [Amycolatopsis acididurans]
MRQAQQVDVAAVIDAAPLSRLQVRTIALCIAIAVLDGFDAQAIGFAAPAISTEWHIPVAGFGLVFAAGLFGMMVGGMVFGPVADRLGRRRVVLVSTATFSVFALAHTLAPNTDVLLVLRFLCGIGLGGITPNLIALASEYSPARRRGTIVTLVVAAMSLGGFLGGFLATALIPSFGWQSVFVVGGTLPLILLAVGSRALPESIRFLVTTGRSERAATLLSRISPATEIDERTELLLPETTARRSPVRTLFVQHRGLITVLLWTVFFMNLLVIYFLLNWMPSLFKQAGLSASLALIATSLYNLGGVIGSIGIGYLADRSRSTFRLLAIGYVAAAVLIGLTAAVAGNAPLMLTAVFLVGVGISGNQTGISAVAADVYPTVARATGVGWAYGIGRIGSIIGPVVGGLLIAAGLAAITIFSLTIVPTIVAALGIVALAAAVRRRRTVESAESPATEVAGPATQSST